MACLTLGFLENILVWIVVLAVMIGVINLLVPWVMGLVGVSLGPLPAILRLIVMGIIGVAVIYFVFDLLRCASLPRLT